jgi:hypothetical protein
MKKPTRAAANAAIAAAMLAAIGARGQTTSFNSGSLGAAGNAFNSSGVTLDLPGALAVADDKAVGYSGGANTTLSYNAALNPATSSPFTVEFWAKPSVDPGDATGPSPLFNRVSSGNRSGWVFFQRSATTGWNFNLYSGSGSTVGFSLTGGAYTVGNWTQVVAVWDGTSPSLYVNGVLATSSFTGPGIYNASTTATLSLGAYDTGSNPFSGSLDEFAFYSTALTAGQISAHFAAASSTTPGTYSSLVLGDGAVEYLSNTSPVPEPATLSLIMVGLIGGGVLHRRRSTRG